MTQEYSAEPAVPPRGDSSPSGQGTAEIVKDQAAGLSQGTAQVGKHAADAAREQASAVAAEAARQGRDLLGQAQDRLGEQAARGQQRLAAALRSLSDQLSDMAGGSAQDGTAADLARQAAARAGDAAHWLGSRQPAQVVDEVQSFARRRPGVFLALAAGAGVIGGRLTRGLTAAGRDEQDPVAPAAAGPAPEAGPWTRDPADAAYQAGMPTGASAEVPAPAGDFPATRGIPATTTDAAHRGDQTALADRQDLP